MIHYFLNWYQGSIWGNLLASLIWAMPAYFWGRHHIKKNHRKNEEIHQQIREIHRKVHNEPHL